MLYCQTTTLYKPLWCSTVIQRHDTSPSDALLSHKDTLPVPVVLFYHTDTVPVPVVFYCHIKIRCQSLWCSTVTQRHGTVLKTRCQFLRCSTSHKDTVPVPAILHKDTVSVPAVFYCHTKTRYLSLLCSTVIQRQGTCPCSALLSPKDTLPVLVVLYCHTKTQFLSL